MQGFLGSQPVAPPVRTSCQTLAMLRSLMRKAGFPRKKMPARFHAGLAVHQGGGCSFANQRRIACPLLVPSVLHVDRRFCARSSQKCASFRRRHARPDKDDRLVVRRHRGISGYPCRSNVRQANCWPLVSFILQTLTSLSPLDEILNFNCSRISRDEPAFRMSPKRRPLTFQWTSRMLMEGG